METQTTKKTTDKEIKGMTPRDIVLPPLGAKTAVVRVPLLIGS